MCIWVLKDLTRLFMIIKTYCNSEIDKRLAFDIGDCFEFGF